MTESQITDKIATLQRAIKTAPTQGLKDSFKKTIAGLKAELKTSGLSTDQLAKKLLGSQRKVDAMDSKQFKASISLLSKRPQYSFLKGMSKGKILDDKKRFAKPVGWRFKGRDNIGKPNAKELAIGKKKKTVYFENRPNRADVVRPVKLAKGGSVTAEGVVFKNTFGVPQASFKSAVNAYSFFGIGVAENMDDSQQIMNGHHDKAIVIKAEDKIIALKKPMGEKYHQVMQYIVATCKANGLD